MKALSPVSFYAALYSFFIINMKFNHPWNKWPSPIFFSSFHLFYSQIKTYIDIIIVTNRETVTYIYTQRTRIHIWDPPFPPPPPKKMYIIYIFFHEKYAINSTFCCTAQLANVITWSSILCFVPQMVGMSPLITTKNPITNVSSPPPG